MNPSERSKIALHAAICSLTDLLKERPKDLSKQFNIPHLDNPDDTIFIIENLQEALNLTLDARKRLMLLNLYEENYGKKKQVEERPRRQAIGSLEERASEDSDRNSTPIPPDPPMEI